MTFADLRKPVHRSAATATQADTPPVLVASTPADGAGHVAQGADITLTFSEAVKPGSGAIVLHRASDGAVLASWSVTDAAVVTFDGASVIVDPSSALPAGSDVYVTMAAGVIRDLAGNSFAGIATATALNFAVASAPVADLVAQIVSVEQTEVSPGDFMFVNYTESNIGDLASPSTAVGIYLSADTVIDPATDLRLFVTPDGLIGGLDPNGWTYVGSTFALPAGVAPGVYYVAAIADDGHVFAEVDEVNNVSGLIRVVVSHIVDGGSGADRLTGTDGIDTLNGQDGNDTLVALGGDDTLDGGVGGDLMKGGAGDDTYFVDDAGDKVQEGNNQGTDTVYSSVTYAIGGQWVENVILTGAANVNAGGNGADNRLTGNAGNNSLNGGAGADYMAGGQGNDIYYIDNAGDQVVEGANAGKDSVLSGISYTLTNNVEVLGLVGFQAIDGTGNALDNTITGNGNVNHLSGGAGKDLLKGLGGNDILTGGADADVFSMSAPGAANGLDHITDFVSGTDRLAFLGTDYGFAAGHHLTAQELHTGAVVGAFAQFIYNTVNHTLYYDADGTGATAAVAVVAFDNNAVPVSNDIIFQ